MFKKIIEKISVLTLIIISILSIVVSIGDLFFEFGTIPYLKETPKITLLLLGLLCLSLGVERLSNLENISRQIANLRKELENVVPAQFFQTSYDSVRISTELVKNAKQRIDVLTYSLEFDPTRFDDLERKSFEKYTESVLNALKSHQNLEYRVIWGYKDPKLLNQKKIKIEERKKLFLKEKVSHKVKFRHKQTQSELFILMVDNKSLLIGFPSITGDIMPRNAIKFTNQPELLSSFSKWYEDYFWNDSRNL
jgi:hypothetical protein